jgi:hypothetical protein
MPTDDPLARARALTNLLDNAVRVPGTGFRVGLDPVLGLVPGLGDVAGAALSGYVVLLASRLGAPTTVIVRMLGNVVIDTVGGTFPVIGDLFDAGWKSNSRNLALLERHLGQPESTKRASRAVVWLTVAALLLLAIGSVFVAVLLVRALFQTFA